jgi:anti-sigma B factor antagonist
MISVVEIADAGITLVEPDERLTLENAHELLHVVKTASASLAPTVIVNMERTAIVDSSGVGALVKAMKLVQGVSGKFALAGLRPELHRTFQLMNLHQVFDIYETETLARASLIGKRL